MEQSTGSIGRIINTNMSTNSNINHNMESDSPEESLECLPRSLTEPGKSCDESIAMGNMVDKNSIEENTQLSFELKSNHVSDNSDLGICDLNVNQLNTEIDTLSETPSNLFYDEINEVIEAKQCNIMSNTDESIEDSKKTLNELKIFNINHCDNAIILRTDEVDIASDSDEIKPDTIAVDSEDSALGSSACETNLNEREDEPQDRSDGSDSGLGSEVAEDGLKFAELPLPREPTHAEVSFDVNRDNFEDFENKTHNLNSTKVSFWSSCEDDKVDLAMSEESEAQTSQSLSDADQSGQRHIAPGARDVDLKSSLKRPIDSPCESEPKRKKKKGISFEDVTVYYFPRTQGFTCVPSQGGSTLGMEREHAYVQKFTLNEHASEQRRLHRQLLQQLRSERHSMQGANLTSSEDSDSEEEISDISESELDLDSYYFLQPVPTRQRRALLRAAGIRKIEPLEKDECRDIRMSREFCGCSCKIYCDPETCSCSQAGIKCQVDRQNFPCGCSRDGCGNTTGRIEFNPVRVRTHFIHTLMRLGLEKKVEENNEDRKKHMLWLDSNNGLNKPCSSYDHNSKNSLLHNVNLTTEVEAESCINSGNFSNIHFNPSTSNGAALPNREDSLDLYSFREDCYNDSRNNLNQDHLLSNIPQHDSYTSSILQSKGPAYNSNMLHFDRNINRYNSDISFPYGHHPDVSPYKATQSFNASNFEDFTHQNHGPLFSPYGSYAQEYSSKTVGDAAAAHASAYQAAQSSYDVYRQNDVFANADNKETNEYTNLNTAQYTSESKSFSDIMQSRYAYSSIASVSNVEPVVLGEAMSEPAEAETKETIEAVKEATDDRESSENFGEIIKKSMAETVTV